MFQIMDALLVLLLLVYLIVLKHIKIYSWLFRADNLNITQRDRVTKKCVKKDLKNL